MTPLNGELFEDEDAYWQAIVQLIEDPTVRPRVPQAVKDVASTVTAGLCHLVGWDKLLDRYAADVVETSAVGFVVARCEDWSELDRGRAMELIDEALRSTQQSRIANNADQIALDDVNDRLTTMTLGLATNAPEGEAVRQYLFTLPAHTRIDHVAPLLIQMGTAMARVKRRDAAAFDQLQGYAWAIGVGLGLLDVIGEVPDQEVWYVHAG